MMDIIRAVEKVADITEFCKTNDIWEILDKLEISYVISDLGSPRTGLKGYCTSFYGRYLIVVNEQLPEYLQVLVAWHELGHIMLDPELLTDGNCLFDHDLCGESNHAERRANLFAAEGLIDDEELLGLLHEGCTQKQAASKLRVPQAFVDYKIRILREYDTPIGYVDLPDTFCLGGDITGGENLW